MSVAQQQMVEIAKALSSDCKVLIFDEPTSSLNEEEAKGLFQVIHQLAEKGIGIFYISHKMDEIFKICNRITIMRDGTVIETVNVKETNTEHVVSNMVGKELGNLYPEKSKAQGKRFSEWSILQEIPISMMSVSLHIKVRFWVYADW